jgi:Ca2+/Na+ antiporter
MDMKNLFMTPTTAYLIRAEYALGLVVSVVLFFTHLGDIRWWPAVGLFLYIDLVGYIPGAIKYHRSPDHRISRTYYVLYNTMHSMVTQGLVALVWIWLWGPEWALLALPIHLCGDRALFGNFLKPFVLHFEPETHQAYRRFSSEFAASASAAGGASLSKVA